MKKIIFSLAIMVIILAIGCGGSSSSNKEQHSDDPISDNDKLPIVIIGPSTVYIVNNIEQEKHIDGTMCTLEGWGEVFGDFAKYPDMVFNYARAGSSAGSFKIAPNENNPYRGNKPIDTRFYGPNQDHYWAKAKEKMQELGKGILLIQFGGNDAHHLAAQFPIHISNDPKKPIIDRNGDNIGDQTDRDIAWDARYKEFRSNLDFYINEARNLNFIPILITSPNQKKIVNGKVEDNRGGYPDEMIKLANEKNVRVLDLHKKTMDEFATYKTQSNLDKRFGECYTKYNARDYVHYERDSAKIIAGWVRDLACQETNSTLCKELIPNTK